MNTKQKLKVILLCGGPSPERGISLNSARSVMDHLPRNVIDIQVVYVDSKKEFFIISPSQLYSNTPDDFDFKLHQTAKPIDSLSLKHLLQNGDIVFPAIHGAFGEDGELQQLLEEYQVPFVGNSSECCRKIFKKNKNNTLLRQNGFPALPQKVICRTDSDAKQKVEDFFASHKLTRAVVKPTQGGSSIGVHSVSNAAEAYEKITLIFDCKLDSEAIIEPFCQGKEFTVVVIQSHSGDPVALIPTEISLSYEQNAIFDFRKKYLPSEQTTYYTPPRFAPERVQQIRSEAEQIFRLFGMRDFVRLDGWLMDDGTVYFTDMNPMSGLEQNSFFFRQSSLVGYSHSEILEYILTNVCLRHQLDIFFQNSLIKTEKKRVPVFVLFGNHNAERQVSLLSGSNVWLKLLHSDQYEPIPFFLDKKEMVWKLPYSYALHHTVEEIYSNCTRQEENNKQWESLFLDITKRLKVQKLNKQNLEHMPLTQFFQRAKQQDAFVFIAMHGAEGENGTFQKNLEKYQVRHNGSNAEVSALCMDKYRTGEVIRAVAHPDILSLPKMLVDLTQLQINDKEGVMIYWNQACSTLEFSRLIIKPRSDGCSAGIVVLESHHDLERYLHFISSGISTIPAYTFVNQLSAIDMPSRISEIILEPFIETDEIYIRENELIHSSKEGWIELTVGILERKGIYKAFHPSITVAKGTVLSLEEKFQGGTGVNLTPPPLAIVSDEGVKKIRKLVEVTAQILGIENYARIDIFFNRFSEKIIVIEANTLPALTPSTVLYHQAFAEEPSMSPVELLTHIVSTKH